MAVIGLGFRDWATGDKPTEAQVQGYWQDQVVMHFATTAARDTAITAPGEGMMAYVAANRSIYRHNGTAWVFIEGWGTGSPEGAVTATKGALWHRTDGGTGTTLYIKESDTSNTGWVAVSSGTSSAGATVATSETTTSTSFTDLATAGPAVTLTTGTKALVIVTAEMSLTVVDRCRVGFAVSGASTVAASDAQAMQQVPDSTNNRPQLYSAAFPVTGLTAGSNTFTAKYKVGSGTGTFINRSITVIDMGS